MCSEKNISPGFFHKVSKKYAKERICLHFLSGDDCDFIISAHSIQKNGALRSIARNGHVYTVNNKLDRKGIARFTLKGCEKASTFHGFCKKHDNEVFEPIDNYPFDGSKEQIILYAYRSICREVFVKRVSSLIYSDSVKSKDLMKNKSKLKFLQDFERGNMNGLSNLYKVKESFDQIIKTQNYSAVNSIVFEFDHIPNLHFSGLIYPTVDYEGKILQDLSKINNDLALVTFCSSPTKEGWAFTFCWLKKHEMIIGEFIRSLFSHVCKGGSLEDALFRLVISACENFAISPEWWEGLNKQVREDIELNFSHSGSPISDVDMNYLESGFEGVSNWRCGNIVMDF